MTHDVIVIGAGSAGLTAAGGLAMFGLRVALVEGGKMGGECLNTGCVPSKALIAAAARAQAGKRDSLGVALAATVDWAGVRGHIEQAIATIAPHDSPERFEAMGVEVIRETARFRDAHTVEVGERVLQAPRIVIATGSQPAIPPIEGLAETPFLTNETLFALDRLPSHLIVLGGGAVGCEMAQAFARLGARVTLIEAEAALAREDAEAAGLVLDNLRGDGVDLRIGTKAVRVGASRTGVSVTLPEGEVVDGSHLLVATGRRAYIASLDLDAADVRHGADGIVVDDYRRTSQRHIYAIGDCRAGPRLTHVAGYEGSLVVLQIALGLPGRVDWRATPRAIYTDPELAQIGLTEAEARAQRGQIEVTREDFAHNDRAVTEGNTRGFIKVIRRGGNVLGVTIVGTHAGELLLSWSQIMTGKASTFALGSAVIAYPTRSEIGKAAAFAVWEPKVFGAWPRRWARLLARLRR
ncbi:FAD-dependent oxidoreductase [Novosphingobium sp.]|uniref:dihydrolipoyl dehydrogenase family protein n=1 Tax=Novosphingobium sp. TaxID=1874826 RepID=UPI0025EA2557|nr:FAD-dependent oxidoreductase [Novosphingobium sp.]